MLLRLARGTGELLMTLGVVILLFVAYLLWWTDVVQHATQHHLLGQLQHQWTAPVGPGPAPSDPSFDYQHVALGQGIAVLRIPRLGKAYEQVVVQGTGVADLQKGPGHITTTAAAGQQGNFTVSGHRVTYGRPFYDLAELRPGDTLVFETADRWYTYVEDDQITVLPTDVWVTDAVPRGRTAGRLLTITTCTPRFSATHRLVLQGHLMDTDMTRAGFLPAALRAVYGTAASS